MKEVFLHRIAVKMNFMPFQIKKLDKGLGRADGFAAKLCSGPPHYQDPCPMPAESLNMSCLHSLSQNIFCHKENIEHSLYITPLLFLTYII